VKVVSADPMVVAHAQRAVVSAEFQTRHTRDEAERVVGHIMREANSRVLQAQQEVSQFRMDSQQAALQMETQIQQARHEASDTVNRTVQQAEYKVLEAQSRANQLNLEAEARVSEI